MLDCFIHGFLPKTRCEVLKENPHTFEEACVHAERVLHLADQVGGGSTYSKFRWLDPPDYLPMDLDRIGAWERYH